MNIPNYPIGEVARYAHVSSGTVRAWHKRGGRVAQTLTDKEPGEALSYLQLIEVAVVAACRDAGMSLQRIREARDYVAGEFKSDHPFAQYRFKTDGKELFMPYHQAAGDSGKGALLRVNRRGKGQGQLAWDEIIGQRLKEFDYEGDLAIRWHVAGLASPIVIDPRISFGAPAVKGVPTWLLKDRWTAGEPIKDTSTDLGLNVADVKKALEFEGVDINARQAGHWLN